MTKAEELQEITWQDNNAINKAKEYLYTQHINMQEFGRKQGQFETLEDAASDPEAEVLGTRSWRINEPIRFKRRRIPLE